MTGWSWYDRPVFPGGSFEGRVSGQSGLVQTRPLLAQHPFARAAQVLLPRRACRQTSHLRTPIPLDLTPIFRCRSVRPSRRGRSGLSRRLREWLVADSIETKKSRNLKIPVLRVFMQRLSEEMTYEVPHEVMSALVNGLLDATSETDATSANGALHETFETVLEDHGADMPEDMRIRFLELAQIRRDSTKACRAFDRARAAGNIAGADEELAKLTALTQKSRAVLDFLQFPFPAEALCKAKSFDEFCKYLPNVDVDTLYGSGHGKISPFPLIWALSAREKPLERVQLMLAAGARTDLTTGRGETVLHALAAMKRQAAIRLPILRLLVFKGADLEAKTIYDQTPLTIAFESGSVADVGFFLTVGAQVREVDIQHATHDPKKLERVLQHLSEDPGHLRIAAKQGSWLRGKIEKWQWVTQEALRDGAKGEFHANMHDKLSKSLAMLSELPGYATADKTKKVTWQNEPGAFWAIQSAETLSDFRRALARVEITSFHIAGTHPIYWPFEAKEDRLERLWSMLAAGASVEGGANGTALHIFAENCRKNAAEQFRMAQMVVQAGGDLEARNYKGLTPLAVAIERRGFAEAAALLQLGASPKLTLSSRRLFGDRYDAPILFAAADDARIFKCMLEMGVDASAYEIDGNSIEDFIRQELSRLTKLRETDCSGNIKRRITRSINNFTSSLKLLNANS